MADQISYDHPIWKLSPKELEVAYLSLTLSKKEIARDLVTTESNVGTHLTKIFDKLGLSGFPDDEKRLLLKDNFGSDIEALVAEIGGDYQGEYRQRRKEATEKRTEVARQKESGQLLPVQPAMNEVPPDPRTRPRNERVTTAVGIPRSLWFIVGFLVLLGGCSLLASNFVRGLFNQPPADTPGANTQVIVEETETSFVVTQNPVQTAESTITAASTSLPATETSTSQTLPTAVTLPIIEHFNKPMSDVWQVTGDPILTTSNLGIGYDGVLTTIPGHFAYIETGNSAWTNYVIHTKMYNTSSNFLLGFRVQDLNNMLGIQCEGLNCEWIVVKDGKKEVLSKVPGNPFANEFTLTLEGENINGLTTYDPGFGEDPAFVTLPPKYQGQFLNGGIYMKFMDVEIDYIEILPVR